MATAEELLSRGSSTDKTLIINQDLRTIVIPRSITNIGVESDDDVLRLDFRMPSSYCGIDLSTFKILINYLNANAEDDVYEVDDKVKRADETIAFSWLVGRHATMYKGDVKFNVCLRDLDESGPEPIIRREFNTTIASLPVLEGLEATGQAVSAYSDILEQWRAKLFGEGESAVAAISVATDTSLKQIASARDLAIESIPAEYTATTNAADEAVRTKADAIIRTVRGRNITIPDSSEDPVRGLRLFGASTQESMTGKNQVNLSTFEFDGSTTYNHRHNATYSEELRNLYQFLSNNTGKSIVLSMTQVGTKSGVEIGTISLFDVDNNLLCTIVPNVPHTIVELPRPCNYAYIYGSTSGASVSNIQIEFGNQATDYEPYCGGAPTPNPKHPMPIVSVEGVATKIGGKNLIPYPYSDTTKTVDGITYTDNGDGSITANGTATGNAVFYFTNVGTGQYINGTVCLSGCPEGGSVSGTGYSVRLNQYINGVEASGLVDTGSGKSGAFDNVLARICFVVLKGGTVKNLTIRPMLEYGDTPTEYMPYVAPSTVRYNMGAAAEYLQGLPVNSGGNYTDESGQQWLCDEVDYARGVYIKRVTRKTLDGESAYQVAGTQVAGTYTMFVGYNDIWIDNEDTFISDRLPCYPSSAYKGSSYEGVYANPGQGVNLDLIIVRLSNDHATDETSFIDFMRDHPVTVLAPLKTPIETPLNDAAMSKSFKDARTAYPFTSIVNKAGAFMEVSYNADLQTYIDNHVGGSGVDIQTTIDENGKHHVTINTVGRGS